MNLNFSSLFRIFSIVLFLGLTHISIGQNPGDPGGDPDIPIDGGILLLAGAGIAYGASKLKQHKGR